MKTLNDLLIEIRDGAKRQGVTLPFDPIVHANLDDLMKAHALVARPRVGMPPTSGPSASSTPPTSVPTPSPAPPSAEAPQKVATDAPKPRGRDLVEAAFRADGFR